MSFKARQRIPESVERGGRSETVSDGEAEPNGETDPDWETESDKETKPRGRP